MKQKLSLFSHIRRHRAGATHKIICATKTIIYLTGFS